MLGERRCRGVEAIEVRREQDGRVVALVDLAHRASTAVTPDRRFVGALPSPTPACVHHEPFDVQVFDARRRSIVVSGRHEMSGVPTCIVVDGKEFDVVSWSGPWPVEERWWDPQRHRRAVRMQVVMGENPSRALVLTLEQGRWRATAWYA